MSRTTGSVPASILEIDVPVASWPSNLETTGNYLALQVHADNKSWTVLLYKDRGDQALTSPDLDESEQQVRDIAIQLVANGGRLINLSENPPRSFPVLDPDDLEHLVHSTTVRISGMRSQQSGSGVITEIRGRKYVLTAHHCTAYSGSSGIRITTLQGDGWRQINRSAGWNDGFDISAFPLPESFDHLTAVPLLEGEVPVGQPIHLSSFPSGRFHLTPGRVRGYFRERTELIHSARSAGGSSGGMLITPQGFLCGVHAGRILTAEPYYLQKYAISSSLIMRLVEKYDW
jgi:hypothetical protein